MDFFNQEKRIRWIAGRTDTTSLRFVTATGKFVAPCEKVVNNRTEFTIEEHDFRYLYGMNVAGSVKAGWWDTISVEEACRMGIHKSAIDQKSRGEIVEGD